MMLLVGGTSSVLGVILYGARALHTQHKNKMYYVQTHTGRKKEEKMYYVECSKQTKRCRATVPLWE